MTYRSRGRSIFEVVVAVMFTGFLVGFITVLCIGNYFRAKRAQERQKQRRMAKAVAANGGGGGGSSTNATSTSSHNAPLKNAGSLGSPRSTFTHESALESSVGGYEAPQIGGTGGVHA